MSAPRNAIAVQGSERPWRRRNASHALPMPLRFWEKVDQTGDCWEWQGYVAPTGYGFINLGGQPQPAHRVAWLVAGGLILEGWQIDHLCRNRRCVRPEHLDLVTPGENTRRGVDARLGAGRCGRGHEGKVYGQNCLACERIGYRRRRYGDAAA